MTTIPPEQILVDKQGEHENEADGDSDFSEGFYGAHPHSDDGSDRSMDFGFDYNQEIDINSSKAQSGRIAEHAESQNEPNKVVAAELREESPKDSVIKLFTETTTLTKSEKKNTEDVNNLESENQIVESKAIEVQDESKFSVGDNLQIKALKIETHELEESVVSGESEPKFWKENTLYKVITKLETYESKNEAMDSPSAESNDKLAKVETYELQTVESEPTEFQAEDTPVEAETSTSPKIESKESTFSDKVIEPDSGADINQPDTFVNHATDLKSEHEAVIIAQSDEPLKNSTSADPEAEMQSEGIVAETAESSVEAKIDGTESELQNEVPQVDFDSVGSPKLDPLIEVKESENIDQIVEPTDLAVPEAVQAAIPEVVNAASDNDTEVPMSENEITIAECDIPITTQPVKSEPFLWNTLDPRCNNSDVYVGISHTLLHALPADEKPDEFSSYLKEIFRFDANVHEMLLGKSQERPAPKLVLNVGVVEAKGLHGKDANGLSDPLCKLFVNESERFNTCMQPETLTPVWNENFLFRVSSLDEFLNLEIWDYDPDESFFKKLKRIKEVKSAKGFKILMKDVVKRKKKQDQNDFMGSVKIPLNILPSRGLEKWFPLEGQQIVVAPTSSKSKNKSKSKGEASAIVKSNSTSNNNKGLILLKMNLATENDKRIAAEEYRHFYHLLLAYELGEGKVAPYTWSGKFITAKMANWVFHELEWQGNLTAKEINLAKWFTFCRVHFSHPLHSSVFPDVLVNILEFLKNDLITESEVKEFWQLTQTLVENHIEFLTGLHDMFLKNINRATQIQFYARTLGLVKNQLLNYPEGKLTHLDPQFNLDAQRIVDKLTDIVHTGAQNLYTNSCIPDENSEDSQIQNMMRIGKILNADLQAGLDTTHAGFKRYLGIDYIELTYRIYDEKFGRIVSPIIEDVCKDLKRLDLKEAEGGSVEDDIATGTTLFELYMTVRKFADFSSHLSSTKDLLIAGGFHSWFYASVAQWLDMAFYKGVNRIKKAVELDTLQAIDKYVQRSSSAVDTAHVFHQIQEFWAQLAWPEPEGSYTFIAKILDELCRCNVLYCDNLCKKLEALEQRKNCGDKYQISDEVCSAVNNIEYLGQEMLALTEKLGTDRVLEGLIVLQGEQIGAQCKRTLETVIENAEESINDKLYELLEILRGKVKAPIDRLIKKALDSTKEEEGVQKLMKYLDDMLIKLKTRTCDGSFDKLFAVIWETTCCAMEDIVHKSLAKKRSPAYFARILTIVHVVPNFFYPSEAESAKIKETPRIKALFDILDPQAASTPELILKYLKERHEYQQTLPPKPGDWGLVTIRAQYCIDIRTLNVEVLNARNLIATDSNGSSDPFVKVRIVPKPLYPNIPRFKTQVKKETLFPLFEETFSMELTAEDMDRAGFIQFIVYDWDVVGQNDFLGECFYPLVSIPVMKSDTPLKEVPQRNLVLHNPKDFTIPALTILEGRDKVARKFVKKEKSKTAPVPDE